MISIIGAGPAGAALARFLSDKGFRVTVYDAAPRPALKPCGWGVPIEVEEYLRIPGDAVINDIMGYRIYLDGRLIHENISSRRKWGYIVDKPRLIKLLLEGVEARFSSPVRFRPDGRPAGGFEGEVVVVASGHYWPRAPRTRLLAIQRRLRGVDIDPQVIEIWFNSSMVGYTWVFPEGEGEARVGVGGFKGFGELQRRLEAFIASRPGLARGSGGRVEGAYLVVSGVDEDLLEWKGPYVVGEALGAVFPLTGEGIRPSIITSWALAESIAAGRPYRSVLEETGLLSNMRLHRLILGYVRRASPSMRARVLGDMPGDVMERVSLGKAGLRDVLRMAVRPGIIASLAKAFLGRRSAPA